jgi:transposase
MVETIALLKFYFVPSWNNDTQKNIVMSEQTTYVKRSQRDYTLSLKLKIVQEIEQGRLSTTEAQRKYGIQARSTLVSWLRKYGSFDWENQTPSNMPKSPEQKIMELEAKVKLLEKQKSFLEQQAYTADSKAIIFDMMIDLAEKEYQIDIRKNSPPGQSNTSENSDKKQ